MGSEHFFVQGDQLNKLYDEILTASKNEVFIVNPSIYPCSLSDKLKTPRNRTITLITRSPFSEGSSKKASSRQKYHKVLIKNGVRVFYNDRIHSKILLLDGQLGVVSSLNFKSKSSSGKNLEAGITTWQINAVESIQKYINDLLNDDETEECML